MFYSINGFSNSLLYKSIMFWFDWNNSWQTEESAKTKKSTKNVNIVWSIIQVEIVLQCCGSVITISMINHDSKKFCDQIRFIYASGNVDLIPFITTLFYTLYRDKQMEPEAFGNRIFGSSHIRNVWLAQQKRIHIQGSKTGNDHINKPRKCTCLPQLTC